MSLSGDGGLLGIPETRLPVDPAAALLASGEEPAAVAAAHPTSSPMEDGAKHNADPPEILCESCLQPKLSTFPP